MDVSGSLLLGNMRESLFGVSAAVAAVFVFAGFVKGLVGLGLPTFSMALLSLFMPPFQAAALLLVPSFVTNVWQMQPWASLPTMLRRLAPMQASVVAGVLGGSALYGVASTSWAETALGVVLLAYALWSLVSRPGKPIGPSTESWLGPVIGLTTGLIAAATGVFVVPAVAYFQMLALTREELVQAMGVSFTVSTLALAVGLAMTGGQIAGMAAESFLYLLPAVAGMFIGQCLRRRLPFQVFRVCLLGVLGVLGIYQIVA